MQALFLFLFLAAASCSAALLPFEKAIGLAADAARQDKGARLWALLVAGSNGWYNYRHQADICHAYQILHRHGIPDERIVVMMYDDIANSANNPTPGKIINQPGGFDVYAGVPKDYTDAAVTPRNFLAALEGNRSGVPLGSKVIDSTSRDHVFVNFADHGAPGLVAFPRGQLYARDLIAAVERMHRRKQFKKLVLYVEACESGSMFDKLLASNIGVFATTASNPAESSYACYYDKRRSTYLGDVYSVNWMQDSDAKDIERETLEQQYDAVRSKTSTSHVMQYGDERIAEKFDVGAFQGDEERNRPTRTPPPPPDPIADAVPSGDVPLHILAHRVDEAKTPEERRFAQEILEGLKHKRSLLRDVVQRIVERLEPEAEKRAELLRRDPAKRIVNHECLERETRAIAQHCFDLDASPYALRQVYVLVNVCQSERPYSHERVVEAMRAVCTAPMRGVV